MSEGLSIGKALAEQGKGYYEEMKVRPDCVLLRPVPGRCVSGRKAGCRMYLTEAPGTALPCPRRVGMARAPMLPQSCSPPHMRHPLDTTGRA